MSVTCPACYANVSTEPLKSHIPLYVRRRLKFYLYECRTCGLQFWHPRFMNRDMYEKDLYGLYQDLHSGYELDRGYYTTFLVRVSSLLANKGALLDIGCGNGSFLILAQQIGFDVWGIDFDRRSIEVAIRKGLTKVFPVSLEEFVEIAARNGQKFDVITMFEVLEHQPEPREFMSNVLKLLKPGGMIVGTVPNSRRLFANLDTSDNVGDYPPHHFLWWSRDSLWKFLKLIGPTKVTVSVKSYFDTPSLSGWWASVLFQKFFRINLAQQSLISFRSKPHPILREVARALFFPLAMITKRSFATHGEKLYFEAYSAEG